MKQKWLTYAISGLVLSCLFYTHGNANENENIKKINLKWSPNLMESDFKGEELATYTKISFGCSFIESRENILHIGKSHKGSGEVATLVCRQSPVNFCNSRIKNVFNFFSIPYKGTKSDVVLEAELVSFEIEETADLRCTFKMRVSAKNSGGLTIWEGNVDGGNTLYSRPNGSDVYSECVSNGLIMTMFKLLLDTSFKDAVLKGI